MSTQSKKITFCVVVLVVFTVLFAIINHTFTNSSILYSIKWSLICGLMFSFSLYIPNKPKRIFGIIRMSILFFMAIICSVKLLNIDNILLIIVFFVAMNYGNIKDVLFKSKT